LTLCGPRRRRDRGKAVARFVTLLGQVASSKALRAAGGPAATHDGDMSGQDIADAAAAAAAALASLRTTAGGGAEAASGVQACSLKSRHLIFNRVGHNTV